MRWLTCLVIFALIASWKANASPFVLEGVEATGFNERWYYLKDPGGNLGFDDISSQSSEKNFLPAKGNLNFGITSDTIWLRIEIQRAKNAPSEWWLEVAPAYIGEATAYLPPPISKTSPTTISSAGISLPFSSRGLKVRNSTFKISLDDFGTHVIYLRLRSNNPINVRATLWQPLAFAEKSASENYLFGMYYGAFLMIFVISAVQWILKPDKTNLWWMIYLVAEGFMTFRMNGLASMYIFPEFPGFNNVAGTVSISLMILSGARFGVHVFAID